MLSMNKLKKLITLLYKNNVIKTHEDFLNLLDLSVFQFEYKNPNIIDQLENIFDGEPLKSKLSDILPESLKVNSYEQERSELASNFANDLMLNADNYSAEYWNDLVENRKELNRAKTKKYKGLDEVNEELKKLKALKNKKWNKRKGKGNF